MQQYDREREFNLLAGIRNAGKSTFTANYCKQYEENVMVLKHISNINDRAFDWLPEKTITNWRQGAKPDAAVKFKVCVKNKKEYKQIIQWLIDENFKNGLVVIDDATIYERHVLTEEMATFVPMGRHYGIDLWMNFHGLSLLPIEQFCFVNYLVLFNTTDNFQYKGGKIPDVDRLQTAAQQAKVNFSSGQIPLKYTPVILNMQV